MLYYLIYRLSVFVYSTFIYLIIFVCKNKLFKWIALNMAIFSGHRVNPGWQSHFLRVSESAKPTLIFHSSIDDFDPLYNYCLLTARYSERDIFLSYSGRFIMKYCLFGKCLSGKHIFSSGVWVERAADILFCQSR